jgi:hypothetical protein
LLGAAAWVMVSAIRRLADPTEVHEETLLIVASLGLAANLASMLALRSGSDENLNQEGAYLEVLADARGFGRSDHRRSSVGRRWVDLDRPGDRHRHRPMGAPPNRLIGPPGIAHPDGISPRAHRHGGTPHRFGSYRRCRYRARPTRLDRRHRQNAVSAHLMLEPQGEHIAVHAIRSARTIVRDRFGLDHSTFQAEIGTDCEPQLRVGPTQKCRNARRPDRGLVDERFGGSRQVRERAVGGKGNNKPPARLPIGEGTSPHE